MAQPAECDHANKPQAAAGARRGGRAAAPEGLRLLTPAPRKRWRRRRRHSGRRALATASDSARGELSSALQLAARRPAARPYASTRSRQLAYAPMRPYSIYTAHVPNRQACSGHPRHARARRRGATDGLPSSSLVLSVTSHGTSHGPCTTICTRHPPGTKGASSGLTRNQDTQVHILRRLRKEILD